MTDDLNLIASYLARRDVPALTEQELGQAADVLVLLGSSLLGPLRTVAEALTSGCARKLLIAGGIGHSTEQLRDNIARHPNYGDVETEDRAEADILHDVMTGHFGITPDLIIVENRSTNCGENATEARRVLEESAIEVSRLIIVQDPTMQRRTHATFQRAWRGADPPEFISFSPFIPTVHPLSVGGYAVGGDSDAIWPFERFVALALGEIARLRDDESGYGPNGRNFIDHIEVPGEVLLAHKRASARFQERAAFQ